MMDSTDSTHPQPVYELVIDGRNITGSMNARLIRLSLAESRGDEADQLDLELDDSDGRMAMPGKGSTISLKLGWAGNHLILHDKGTFEVDEVEHSGAPDRIVLRARSAELKRQLRMRSEHSYHDTTLGQIVRAIAQRNGLQARVDEGLASVRVPHIDQTHESDLHFCSRLAKQYDAVCTVKKGKLAFIPINSSVNAAGQQLHIATLTRADGDGHRYHTAERNAYSGVRAYWNDPDLAEKRSTLVQSGVSEKSSTTPGTEDSENNEKRLKDTYGSETEAKAAAQAEMGRVGRAKATMSLKLALGRPELMPQTPLQLQGFKDQIDDTPWLVVKITHELADTGLTSQLELETRTG